MKTIVVFSTDKLTYVIEKAGYKHTKAHKFVFEVDIPEELMQQPKDRIVLPKKRKLKEYIDTADKLQLWLQKELQKAVDSVK